MTRSSNVGSDLTLVIWDLTFISLLFVASSEFFTRFGLGSIVWAILYGLMYGRLAMKPLYFANVFGKNIALFIYPLVCILSAVWSLLPNASFVAGVQMLSTVMMGIYAGCRFKAKTIYYILYYCCLLMILVSVLNLLTGAFGERFAGGGGFLGVFAQKNVLGKACLIGIIAGLGIIFSKFTSISSKLIVAAGMVPMLFCIMLSASATSIIMVPVSFGIMVLLCYKIIPKAISFFIISTTYFAFAVGPMLFIVVGFDPVGRILGAFNKDSTLTGRTQLWEIASYVISTNPVLGVGYITFWDAPKYAYYAKLAQSIGGENVRAFHNVVYEVWVATGMLGVFSVTLLAFIPLYKTFISWFFTKSAEDATGITMITTGVLVSLLEPDFYRPHTITIVLVVMICTLSMRRIATVAGLRRVEKDRVDRNTHQSSGLIGN